jgi:7-keto-8-aminopelargonate synthetase-like enzyme
MDGDFAPMVELAKLRKKHLFLLVIDDVSHFYILMLMKSGEAV